MAYVLDVKDNRLVAAEIVRASEIDMPPKKEGGNFDWNKQFKELGTETYVLRLKKDPNRIEGVVQFIIENEMLVMNTLEIAPHNIGSKNKRYDFVAGCLIAFGCRKSFKLKGVFKGFLAFTSKSYLIEWYMLKYGAQQGLGQRMFIDDESGLKLIEKYLAK